jgi:hypothetical protein
MTFSFSEVVDMFTIEMLPYVSNKDIVLHWNTDYGKYASIEEWNDISSINNSDGQKRKQKSQQVIEMVKWTLLNLYVSCPGCTHEM